MTPCHRVKFAFSISDESPPKKRKLNITEQPTASSSSSSPSSSNVLPNTSSSDAPSNTTSSEPSEQPAKAKVAPDESVPNNEQDNKEIDTTIPSEVTTSLTISAGKPPIIDEMKEKSVERNILKKIELTLNAILKYFEDDSNSFETPTKKTSTSPPADVSKSSVAIE